VGSFSEQLGLLFGDSCELIEALARADQWAQRTGWLAGPPDA
jgi:hypothetical protein